MRQLKPTTPAERKEFLSDTEKLVFPGFLSQTIEVAGLNISIRSSFPSDFLLLDSAFPKDRKKWSIALASRLVWQIDGYAVFEDPNKDVVLRELFWSLPQGAFETLFSVMLSLVQRAIVARNNILYFLFEDESREMWMGYGKQNPNLDRLTGLPGLERLGLNNCQKMWIAWNEAEDQRRADEFEWMCVKQSIAPHAPKAIEKMNKREKQEKETRQKDRQKKLDEWYYKLKGVLDSKGKLINKDGETVDPYSGDQVSMAYTSDELAEEMRRWVTGEQDWHDQVIQQYKADIKNKMLQERLERDRRLEEAQQEMAERQRNLGIRSRDRLVGYTPDQVRQFKEEAGFDHERPGARTISYAPSRKQAAFDKWVDAERSSGALVEEDGKLVAKKEIPRPEKDERSLQDKISSRLPRLDRGS